MSSHTAPVHAPSDPGRLPMTLPLLAEKKRLREPIVMVTAYDYPSARAAEAAGVDLVLVGDSAATTVLGYNSTTPVELGDMLVLARAARLVHHGDTIIVISYGQYDEAELSRYEPRVVHVEANTNRIITIDDEVATLLA